MRNWFKREARIVKPRPWNCNRDGHKSVIVSSVPMVRSSMLTHASRDITIVTHRCKECGEIWQQELDGFVSMESLINI